MKDWNEWLRSTRFFFCECGGEAISVQWDDDLGRDYRVWVSTWKRAPDGGTWPLRFRLKRAWEWLIGRPDYANEQILTRETARELGEHLLELANKPE